MSPRQRSGSWLALGALAGVAVAAASLLQRGEAPAPVAPGGDVVAWVDGRPIAGETLARFVGAVARERGGLDLDAATRREILERLIDEELLLQRGLELGLERREPAARRAIVSAVVDALAADDGGEPDRAELEAFYGEHRARWARPGAEAPPLDQVLESVRAAWLQRRHDAQLREAIAALRARAEVRIVDAELAAAKPSAPAE